MKFPRSPRLSRPDAQRILREAAEASRVGFEERHCRERMVERGVTEEDVLRCMVLGRIVEGPALNARGQLEDNGPSLRSRRSAGCGGSYRSSG